MDPEALFPRLPGDPDAVEAVAAALGPVAAGLRGSAAPLAGATLALAQAWTGGAGAAAVDQVGQVAGVVGRVAGPVADAGLAVRRYAEVLRDAQEQVGRWQAAARRADAEAAAAVVELRQRVPALPPADAGEVHRAHVDAALAAARTGYPRLVAQVRAEAGRCAAALRSAVPGQVAGRSPAQAATAARAAVGARLPLLHEADLRAAGGTGPAGTLPPTGTDAAGNARWWALLTAAERAAVVVGRPDLVGRCPGLPAAVRGQANEALARADVAALGARPRLTGAERHRLANARAVLTQLAAVRAVLDPRTLRPTRATLLIHEPDNWSGDGRAAIAVGDLDTADNVAVCVPGLGSTVAGYLDNLTTDAVNLHAAARTADRRRSTAVVAWLGYDAPGFGTVAADNAAAHGARLLAGDVAGIRAGRSGPPPHLTVVGHSYGSATAGAAAAGEGLAADDLVLIGSPGATVDSATDLRSVPTGHVYVGSASRDLVTTDVLNAAGFDPLGPDPAGREFGATRFEAESTTRSAGVSPADHSRYYDRNSESLDGIARIVTGQYDRVGHAGHRETTLVAGDPRPGARPVPVTLDPEWDRTPTGRTTG